MTLTTDETITCPTDLIMALIGVLEYDDDAAAIGVDSTRTFNDAGLLTSNEGLIVRLANGAEFQLTVVQSHDARDDDTLDENRVCAAGTPHCASLHVDVDSPCETF